MNYIQLFEQEQEENFRRKMEINERYRKHNSTLTDEEKAKLEELKKRYHSDKTVTIVTTTATGESTEVAAIDYFRSVDENMETMNSVNAEGVEQEVKLVNKSDDNFLDEAANAMKNMSSIIYDQIRNFMVNPETSDERIREIILRVSEICKQELGQSTITSDMVQAYFFKKTYKYIADLFPEDIIAEFITEDDVLNDPIACKEKLANIFGIMILQKDEFDATNEYIEQNMKVVQILSRLEECGHDLAEALKSPETFAEAVARSRADTGEPKLDEVVQKYKDFFKVRVNGSYDYFTIRYVMMRELAAAYEKVKSEYGDQESIDIIQNEIDECYKKAERHLDVANLTHFRTVYEQFEKAAKTDKRTSKKGLQLQGRNYIEKIKKCKVDLSFPGYTPDMKNANAIYLGYLKRMKDVCAAYNSAIDKSVDNNLVDLKKIDCDVEAFADVLLVTMGRLMKSLNKNTSDKYDALELHGYFQRFSQIGLDLFSIPTFYDIVKPMVDYISEKNPKAN